jgi:NADH-quinone oxidoreductase subunit F
VQAAGSMLGSASLIVLDEDTCIVRAAALMEDFFRHESCGKCTPCREGTSWLFKILSRIERGLGKPGDLDLLLSLAGEVSGKVLCALGDFATSPVVATVKQYEAEYRQHIEEQRCPFEPW